jgi:membrane protein YdbS with pleckstrin-like domain
MEKCWNCGSEGAGSYCPACGESQRAPEQGVSTPRQAVAVREPAARPAYQVIPNTGPCASVHRLSGAVQRIGEGKITGRASEILNASDETMVWEDSPSAALLAGLILKYLVVLSIGLAIASKAASWRLAVGLLAFALAHIGIRYAQLRSTRYRMTSQRLEVKSGLLNQRLVPYELHHLGTAVISSPLFLRLFGCSNLTITAPLIPLWAIRNAEAVRDLLRGAGQIEAERSDKIRWR